MPLLDDAQKLAAAGQSAAAADLVRRAAENGDTEGMFALANWRLFGLHGPRDLSEAHQLLDRAMQLGHVEAARLKATLVGNGTGCPSDPDKAAEILKRIEGVDDYARAQLAFSATMQSDANARALPTETLCDKPFIRSVRGLLTRGECEYIQVLARPHLQRSFVIDPSGARVPHPTRTSSGMSFGPTQEDRVIHLLNRRLAAITGTEVDWGEPLHILSYAPGQEYKPHVDALPAVDNQRHWTVLVYLNEDYAGGATRFDRVGVEYRGRTGDALVFRNVDEDGEPDPLTRHAGLPVASGVKWLATRWIRAGAFHPFTDS